VRITIVVAGTGFRAVQEFLWQAIPGARCDMIDSGALRTAGFDAEVLIPAMARIDATMMDRVRGLRLIQCFAIRHRAAWSCSTALRVCEAAGLATEHRRLAGPPHG